MLLRLIPTSVHTQEEIDVTIVAFKAIRDRLNSGKYKELEEKLGFKIE